MGNKKIVKYIGHIVLVVALLVSVIILNVSVQNNSTSSDATKLKTSQQQTKLNVAIVNEDQAVQVDEKEYNLGASYVKNIERDNSQNWSVVTRGAAETGLEKGKYQLVLTIPSNFSEKVLDVNSIHADKALVSYKVNAAGNMQVENEANKLAKDIVADLNSQLVDMYMASILSNLYTAQQNVQTSSQVQESNIGSYRTNLLDPAVNSRNIFPTLHSMSSSSVEANNALKNTLESYAQAFDTLDNSQSTYGTNFGNLLKQRGDDKISHAEFMSQLLEMNQHYLSEQTSQLYDNLKETQEKMTSQLGETTQAGTEGTDNLAKQVEDLEAALKAEREKLTSHKEGIKTFVESKLEDYYGNRKVDLEQLFTKAGLKNLNKAETALKEQLATAIGGLPAENFSGQSFTAFGLSITVPHLDYSVLENYGKPSNSTRVKDLSDLASQETTSSEATAQAGTKAKVSWEAPAGVTVQSVSYAGTNLTDGQEVTLKEDGTFEVHYSVAQEASSDKEASSTDATINISLNGVQAASAPVDIQAGQRAAATYGAKAQEIASSYAHVQDLLDAYQSLEALKTEDMTDALADLLTSAIQSNLDSYQTSLTQGDDAQGTHGVQENLDVSISQLKTKIEAVRASNTELAGTIGNQLKLYDGLKERLTKIAEAQSSNSAAYDKTDSELTSLNAEFTSLLSATSGVKTSSQSNVQAAESVNQIFNQFNQELANAQGSTEKLSNDAEQLMRQFNEELAANGDFVASFVKVLNNAYENGVPNEVLLNFLSSPVAQNSSSVRASVNVYRPFTWILLLEIVSLFTAYLFATQNVVRRVKDKFKLDKLQDTDITTVSILAFLALGIGLSIGLTSSVQLQVGREYVPSWVLLIVLASFILVQGHYLLLKHSRIVGMGLAFFMMISFVYLSSAVGTTASLTGFPAFIKSLNALSILENLLSAYFDGQTAGFFVFFGLLIVLGLLVAANIFIRQRKQQAFLSES